MSTPSTHDPKHERPLALFWFMGLFVALAALSIVYDGRSKVRIEAPLEATVGDLVPVHASVQVAEASIREPRRLRVGDRVTTDAGGRARLRLDGGATIVVDGASVVVVVDRGIALERGRAFAQVGEGGAAFTLGDAVISARDSAVALERREHVRAYVARGEIRVAAGGAEHTVRTGERVELDQGVTVKPERGFDDWTGGLAAPWASTGPSRRAVPELWGRVTPGETGSPLTIRRQDVRATILGELAETVVVSTFFNAGEREVLGDVRLGLPAGAIVSGFAVTRGDDRREATIALAERGVFANFDRCLMGTDGDVLEWAGEGWVRGRIPKIAPGQSVVVEVRYSTWLPVRTTRDRRVVQYRLPLAGEGVAPRIGDFSVTVDATPAGALALAAGMGARASGATVTLTRADFRPEADFVVEAELATRPTTDLPSAGSDAATTAPAAARAWVARAEDADGERTILVRTEAPRLEGTPERGVSLVLVLDTSASVDPAALDTGRAFVESLVKSLDDKDRIAVLASDTSTRPVGPAELGPADSARRAAILEALASVERGGATDLGRALEDASTRLPADAPSGMIVYVGDGQPSVGDSTAEAILARLARRSLGTPRLGAVLTGPATNRRAIAELLRGSGPLVEVGDPEQAALASIDLLTQALSPAVTDVRVDLGPDVARVHPREAAAVIQGSTLTFVGKLSGPPPKAITLRYRSGDSERTERRVLAIGAGASDEELARRWAEARAQAMALAGRGREAVTDAALRVGLVTPWTAFTTARTPEYGALPTETRVLELGTGDSGFDVDAASEVRVPSSLPSERDVAESLRDASVEESLRFAAGRTIDAARGSLKACRDSRAALRPDLPGSVMISLKIDGDGRASDAQVENAGDALLARCVATVVEGLVYPRHASVTTLALKHTIVWPPPEPLRGKKCSPTSQLGVPLRRGVWRERLERSTPIDVFAEAHAGCELATWTAKRALLELTLQTLQRRPRRGQLTVAFAQQLDERGELEAAALLRREALRRATFEEQALVRSLLLEQERAPWGAFQEAYRKAASPEGRLAIVRDHLAIAPHDPRLRERLVALLTEANDRAALETEVARLRADPFVDATLLADAAHALRSVGADDASRRTYGEIAERGRENPWALSLLGDRLRGEGLFDDAVAAYAACASLVPQDGATELRLALAQLGAGRVDVAVRSLGRLARTGGGRADPATATLSEHALRVGVAAVLRDAGQNELRAKQLTLAVRELGPAPVGPLVAIETPPGRDPIVAWIERDTAEGSNLVRPEAAAARIGFGVLSSGRDGAADAPFTVLLAGPQKLAPHPPTEVTVHALVGARLVTSKATLPSDGTGLAMRFAGGTFATPEPRKDVARPAGE
jgi:hypothetical protein